MKKKLVLMTSALMAISLLTGCGNKHTHEWCDVSYTWAEDNSTCTATRVCKGDESHKEEETVNSVYTVLTAAQCEVDGEGQYTVTFTNEAFESQSKTIVLEAIGHNWGEPTYTWASDYSSCTATRVCLNDATHIESETADSAYTEIIPATCDADGSAVYDAAFENKAFEVQSHEITLPATGHEWGEVSYTWSDDNSTCTATRVCKGDESHVQTETVDTTSVVVTEAKCEEDGLKRYTADFKTNEAFLDQTKDVTLEASGHEWGEVSYTWSDDNSTCTATRVCAHDATHVDTETVNSTYVVVEEAKCEEDGKGRYTADFTNEAFVDQTKDITLEAIGHKLIAHDAHAETCTEAGNTAYWSCERCEKLFSDEEGKNETTAEALAIAASGHDYQFDSFVWADDYSAQAKYVCSRDANHVEMHDATVISKVTKEATCVEDGVETYTATYAGHTGTKEKVLPKLGHTWGTPTYEWSEGGKYCTATAICEKDSTHKLEEKVECKFTELEAATEEADGKGKYTATFENKEFATQEKEVVIESLPTLSKLTFTSNGDGTYSVKGKNDDISGRVKIPSTYGDGEAEGSVTTLPNSAFFVFDKITEVFIPNSIKTMGNDAFYKCEKMTDVHFAENSVLESIGNYAFQSCHSLVSVTLPKSVKTLGNRVFDGLDNLESVVFEEGNELESIGTGCFEQCPKLKELDLPNSVETIKTYSVCECSSLKTLWLPKGLKTLEIYCIQACPIENMHFKGTVEEWNKVSKANNWGYQIATSVVHCTDGDVTI